MTSSEPWLAVPPSSASLLAALLPGPLPPALFPPLPAGTARRRLPSPRRLSANWSLIARRRASTSSSVANTRPGGERAISGPSSGGGGRGACAVSERRCEGGRRASETPGDERRISSGVIVRSSRNGFRFGGERLSRSSSPPATLAGGGRACSGFLRSISCTNAEISSSSVAVLRNDAPGGGSCAGGTCAALPTLPGRLGPGPLP